MKWKCKLLLLKCTLMVKTERNQEKVVVTKICFYGSTKTEWKIKVCVIEEKGSVAKMIKMRGNNLMLTSKLHILIEISDPCWWIFTRLQWEGFFWWHDQNEGNNLMLTSKLHILLNISDPCWWIFTRPL